MASAGGDRLWIVRDGGVAPYDGDLESYRAECHLERSGRKVTQGNGDGANGAGSTNGGPRLNKAARGRAGPRETG